MSRENDNGKGQLVEDFSLESVVESEENNAQENVTNEQQTEYLTEKVKKGFSRIKDWLLEDYFMDIESEKGIEKVYNELNKLLLENHAVYACVEKDPSFLGVKEDVKSDKKPLLFEIYKEQYGTYKDLLVISSAIDKVDMFMGPLEAGFISTGYDIARKIAGFSRVVQECVKLPFAIYYLAKTNKINHLGYWAASEAIAISSGFGRVIDVAPLYRMMAERFVRDKTCEKFIDTIIDKYGEFVEVSKNDSSGRS